MKNVHISTLIQQLSLLQFILQLLPCVSQLLLHRTCTFHNSTSPSWSAALPWRGGLAFGLLRALHLRDPVWHARCSRCWYFIFLWSIVKYTLSKTLVVVVGSGTRMPEVQNVRGKSGGSLP